MTCLSKKEPTIWSEINEVLIGQEAISTRFPLKCVRHSNITEVANREEVEALKHAGCLNPCDAPLPCGHTCKVMCHGEDQEHVGAFKCREKCMKRCRNGHTCQAPCQVLCPLCPFMMPQLLVCGHSRQLECHKANLQAYCTETVEIKLERCGHNQLVLCKLTEQSNRHKIVCKSDCKQNFKCGHVCKRTCHVSQDPDHKLTFLCEEPCELINKSCPRKHRCKKKCREPCGDCLVNVEKTLPCNHKAEMTCCRDVGGFLCKKDCERTLPCGHDCKNECCALCGPCKIKVEKVIEECGHRIYFKCSDIATRSHCKQPCRTIKSCGHPCTGMCKEICEELDCVSQVNVTLPCGHEASVPCGDVKRNRYSFTTACKAPCQAKLPCGHRCKGTCGSCLEGRVHIPCEETCKKPLLCNHNCQIRCNGSLHSCTLPKCFNTCWRDELKNQPRGARQQRGKKKLNDFDPKKRMIFDIRNEFRSLNNKMYKIAQSYNGNKTVVQAVKKIQVFVNKSQTITKYDEELPILKTCLFKVDFISVVFKIMMRLRVMKLPSAKMSELESLLEKLVARSASNHVMGIYEMTQLQEQLIWISLVLDVHNVEAVLGPKNDPDFTEWMFITLNEVKISFGSKERPMVWQMLKDYFKRMAVELPLTGVDMEDLFPSTDKYCQPICHHRVDKVMELVGQNDGRESAEAVNDGSNDGKNGQDVIETTPGRIRSLVSEDYNDGVVLPKKSKNSKKRAQLAGSGGHEKMDVDEVSSASKAADEIVAGSGSGQSCPKSTGNSKWGTILEKELNCPENLTQNFASVEVNETIDRKIMNEQTYHSTADDVIPFERSPYVEASHLLSQMIIEANQPSGANNGVQLKNPNKFQAGDSSTNHEPDGASSIPNAHPGRVQAEQNPSSWSIVELVDSIGQPSHKETSNQNDWQLTNFSAHGSSSHSAPSTQPGRIQAEDTTKLTNSEPLHSQFAAQPQVQSASNPAGTTTGTRLNTEQPTPSTLSQFTVQTIQNPPRPNTALLSTSDPTANRLDATRPSPQPPAEEPLWNIVQPDAEASVYMDEID